MEQHADERTAYGTTNLGARKIGCTPVQQGMQAESSTLVTDEVRNLCGSTAHSVRTPKSVVAGWHYRVALPLGFPDPSCCHFRLDRTAAQA